MSSPTATISYKHKEELLLEIDVLRDNIHDVQSAIATAGHCADHLTDLAAQIESAVGTLRAQTEMIPPA